MKYLKLFENYNTIELRSLVGLHMLSGVDITTESGGENDEDATVVTFILDGITYKASEDPSDGYRSYCSDVVICNDKVINDFPEHEVMGEMDKDEDNNIIIFTDTSTNGVVLEIGTSNYNDYYPCAIVHWTPENLELNQAMLKYNL